MSVDFVNLALCVLVTLLQVASKLQVPGVCQALLFRVFVGLATSILQLYCYLVAPRQKFLETFFCYSAECPITMINRNDHD